ncbi:MAG: hypothetical protein A2V21_305640 [Deltaproteobacteria bacterium GWC2_55_46]|nr:MAG: hypothetical protein A2Z79_09500 [Deltaproteobacteria bacterium GWA2_55_82]OGQ65020.1 MAG: hypothetical protein A3I81_02125 [Deltaproteobacteria bacterium RIFCSPLOWO2_02_FULL_55_12]OIJ73792.1 MAG: hypothetical protein A2V21_305640 [Deltaproteobacteria bacterium GWC2_55_46]
MYYLLPYAAKAQGPGLAQAQGAEPAEQVQAVEIMLKDAHTVHPPLIHFPAINIFEIEFFSNCLDGFRLYEVGDAVFSMDELRVFLRNKIRSRMTFFLAVLALNIKFFLSAAGG